MKCKDEMIIVTITLAIQVAGDPLQPLHHVPYVPIDFVAVRDLAQKKPQ